MPSTTAAYTCAALLVVTAALHSGLGEVRLIAPLLRQRDGVLKSDLARFLIRVVWHMMSVTFLIIAAAVAASAHGEDAMRMALLAGTGLGVGVAGVIDMIGSRGRHIGWPLLVGIGVAAIMALWG